MSENFPSLQIQTFGNFRCTVLLNTEVVEAIFSEFDATLITILLGASGLKVPLLRLKSVLFPRHDRAEFDFEINQSIGRICHSLGVIDPRLSNALHKIDSALVFDSQIVCDIDFKRLAQSREAIESLSITSVTDQLAYDQGEFLQNFVATPWIEKRRGRFARSFHSLLARQMQLYAELGITDKAESVAHKLLQVSPFNLSALDVLSRINTSSASGALPILDSRLLAVNIKLFGSGEIAAEKSKALSPLRLTGYARKLLSFIACSPGRSSSKEMLFDTLWPKATKTQARQRLHVALYELRVQLDLMQIGFSAFLTADRVAVSLNQKLINSVDIDLLRDSAQILDKLSLGDIDRILAAISGEFLQGERELSWITQMRRNCDHQLVKLMVRKAELLLSENRIADAKNVAELAFEKHPSNEEACAVLMRCHQELGSRELAIDTFDKLRRVLRDEFDMKVSEKTLTLANSIRQNEPISLSVPTVEMRVVLDEYRFPEADAANATTLTLAVAPPFEAQRNDPVLEGAQGGLRRMFLDLLVQTVWVWGAPGLGKKTLIQAVANEFRNSALCKLHWLESESILDDAVALKALVDVLASRASASNTQPRSVVIATWPTTPARIKALVGSVHLADNRALCIFVSLDFPKVKSCVKLRAPGFEAWSQRSGSIEVSPAVNAFCQFAQARGFAQLVDRSSVSYLDALCKYCGGVPGILDELAERLDISPMNLLQDWLSMQTEAPTHLGRVDQDSFTASYCGFIRGSAKAQFCGNARLVLEALCAVRSPISLYSLADILCVSRFEVITAVEALVETSLVTTFRSKEFDLVFVCVSGFTADVLVKEHSYLVTDRLLNAIVIHYGEMNFPKAQLPAKSNYRFVSEVLRFEYVWIEAALNYALKNGLESEIIKLSRLLRRFYFDGGHVEAAAKFFNKALSSSTDIGDLADFNAVLGGLYGRAGYGHLARKHLLQAMRYCRRINDEIREATALHSLGLAVGASGRFERGVSFLNAASALYLKNGLTDRDLVSVYSSAFLHVNQMDLKFARNILDTKRPTQLSNHSHNVTAWHTVKAYLEFFEKDFVSSWHHVTIAMKMGEDLNYVQMCFKTQLLQSMLQISENKAAEAAQTLKRTVRQMIFHDYRSDAAHAMALLTLSHLILGQVSEALEVQAKAEVLIESVDDMQSISMLIYSRLTCMVALNMPIDETWFRSQVVAKWRLFPAYVRLGFTGYRSIVRSKMGLVELPRYGENDGFNGVSMPIMFTAVNQAVESYISREVGAPWFKAVSP